MTTETVGRQAEMTALTAPDHTRRQLFQRVRIGVACLLVALFGLLSIAHADEFVDQETIAEITAGYQLAAGDVLSISVFGESDLSFDRVRLNEAGAFPYPFLGEVQVGGMTAREVEQLLHDGLSGDYLVSPRVSVSVIEYRQFFITGEVRSPGAYGWEPGMNVRRAVTLAGGLTDRASRRRMEVIGDGDSTSDTRRVDMDDIVMPGDTVTIGTGLF